MNNVIFVAGAPASGKSVAKNEIQRSLTHDVFQTQAMTDKEALHVAVIRDLFHRQSNPDGSLESDDTILANPSAPRETWSITFKTSRALNEAHERMFDTIALLSSEGVANRVIVAEIAYGKDAQYPNGPLRQSAGEFVTQFIRLGFINRMLLVDIQASLEVRRPRNLNRVGRIPDEEFIKYFGDDGLFGKQEIRFFEWTVPCNSQRGDWHFGVPEGISTHVSVVYCSAYTR